MCCPLEAPRGTATTSGWLVSTLTVAAASLKLTRLIVVFGAAENSVCVCDAVQ